MKKLTKGSNEHKTISRVFTRWLKNPYSYSSRYKISIQGNSVYRITKYASGLISFYQPQKYKLKMTNKEYEIWKYKREKLPKM